MSETLPHNLTINDMEIWRDLWRFQVAVGDKPFLLTPRNNYKWVAGTERLCGAGILDWHEVEAHGQRCMECRVLQPCYHQTYTEWLESTRNPTPILRAHDMLKRHEEQDRQLVEDVGNLLASIDKWLAELEAEKQRKPSVWRRLVRWLDKVGESG